MFGINKDVLVSRLSLNSKIASLHNSLKNTLDNCRAIYDFSNYVGEGYRPHATVQVDGKVVIGQKILIDSYSLVDMAPDGDTSKRRLIKTFYLIK